MNDLPDELEETIRVVAAAIYQAEQQHRGDVGVELTNPPSDWHRIAARAAIRALHAAPDSPHCHNGHHGSRCAVLIRNGECDQGRGAA